MKKLLILLAIITLSLLAFARLHYTGYSGAPGSYGTCASSCHGSGGGTIQVTGFPIEYIPDQMYEVTISHAGGSQISQFNGSCRIGTGMQNAGFITAGTNTATYNVGCETNGIHFSSNYHDTGVFFWTAPSAGAGDVRLYIAGQQGNYGGPNTSVVLTATEQQSTVEETVSSIPKRFTLFPAYPNPFNPATTVTYRIPRTDVISLSVFDINGKLVTTLYKGLQQPGTYRVSWDANNSPSGVYFVRLSATDVHQVQKILLVK